MTYNNDSLFLFVSETDLLPVWYTHDHSFSSDFFAENLWDDTFSQTHDTFSPQNHPEEASVFPKVDESYGQDQIKEEEEEEYVPLQLGVHENPPVPVTHVHSVVWEKPSVLPAEDFPENRTTMVNFYPETPFVVHQHQNELYAFSGTGTTEECNVEHEAYAPRTRDTSNPPNFLQCDDKGLEEPTHEKVEETESFGSELLEELSCDPSDFKLPASKSPIMEAMVVCAIKNWGISIHKSAPNQVVFRVSDFDRYYKISRAICSKQHPTEDIGSRVKSLRRWFDNFPKKKDRQDNPNFLLAVKANGTKKVNEMIERNTRLMGVQKRRRRQ